MERSAPKAPGEAAERGQISASTRNADESPGDVVDRADATIWHTTDGLTRRPSGGRPLHFMERWAL
jgi:hypothetical protein